ncbi:ABC transporter ATP-binding protein [Pollutimonas harenae]|uniref:ABC transporter ATP-binding protein n=1 Tax=Pollutimonas harenae TaxID=657015 RepID=A0A853GVQ5_9BURK|nr:ABC transporter ATP-binding protein [Pollutimonas harenae]NYT84856.1 ABC transporter ATP-binding protein [Pollutimonas harenae]TEA72746.1 ABC transporter ATP-binding protein [Pollutimonas harenae]
MTTSTAASPVLKVEGIDAFYDSSQVLFGLSLFLNKGETLALLGRNGAGKSTTMKSIAGIVRGRKGSISLAGKEIRGQAPHQIARAGIAFVPEDRQIFPELSVEDNLLIAIKRNQQGGSDWTLERIYDMLPLLKPLRMRLGGQLSGGEQQMLTVGRALMGNPSVILLDEPSEGLAPIMVQKIGELIGTLRELGTTIVLAEQNLHFCLGLADHAVVIDKGKDVFYGTIDELSRNDDIKQRYLSV